MDRVVPEGSRPRTHDPVLEPAAARSGPRRGFSTATLAGRVRLAVVLLLALLAALIVAPGNAHADGIIIPEPPPWPEPPPLRDTWLTIEYHRVRVTIEDQIAVTRVDQSFLNEHDWEAEGTYVFPLPEGATVSEFTMWVDGQPVEGKVLEADEARRIYEDIVRRRRDPALLEYVGRRAVQARVFPIPPGEARRIELEYTEVLELENGLVDYVYPLDTEKFSAQPLEECSVQIDVRSAQPMHALYSPTHQDRVFIERDGDYAATVSYEELDVLPDRDFKLVYTVSQEDVGLNLLTYPDSADEGFFLLLAAPTVEVAQERVVPRDIILVLDTSGSMEGEKLRQAKDALGYVLRHLNEEDRFNVIAFSSGIQRYATALRPSSEGPRAINWVQGLEALGGTNIERALHEALSLAEDDGRPDVLIFLTDGQPTEGVTAVDQILVTIEAMAPDEVRLFPFGVGDDVNTVLLDTLAEQYRGATAYVRPDERIDEEVSGFFAKIRTPVLTDLRVDFGDVVAEDVYPYPLPDLFAGSQLIAAGRYRLPGGYAGESRVVLSGEVNGMRREYVTYVAFGRGGGRASAFIPRLWATRKIGHLMTQIRLRGEKREWVDAIVDLSVRYGIITPYTSFLIEEDDILTQEGREEAAEKYMATPMPNAVGAPAIDLAEEEAGMRDAESAAPAPSGGAGESAEAARLRHAGTKTFVLQDGVWVDTAFDPDAMDPERVDFGSELYYELLAERPEWGDYLALGERVIFVVEVDGAKRAIEVGEGIESGSLTLPSPTPSPSVEPTSVPDTPGPTTPTATDPSPTDPAVTPSATLDEPTPASTDPDGSSGPLGRGLCGGALALALVGAVLAWRSKGPKEM